MFRRWPKVTLVAAMVLVACVDNPPEDPTERYEGDILPCDVVVDGSHEPYDAEDFQPEPEVDPLEESPPDYWRDGPFPTWNTTPDKTCGQDPTIPEISDDAAEETLTEQKMYITYPARSIPTRSGDGRVREGAFPVIVFAHANHDRKCNIYRGYYSLHDHWASWGFIVVSIDGTATNCRPGNRQNIELRLNGMLAAVEALRDLNDDPSSRFHDRLDLERLIFAGHSRGGGAALEAAKRHGGVDAVINMQGIDLTAFGFGATTLPPFPVVSFTAGEDVDLNYPLVEPMEDQLGGPYTWVNINGGIHAYTADSSPLEPDDEPKISREQQHDISEYYSTAFLDRVVGLPASDGSSTPRDDPAERVLFSHEGTRIVDESISKRGVYARWWSDREKRLVDDFDGPNATNGKDVNELGGENSAENLDTWEEVPTYKPEQETAGGLWGKSYSMMLESSGDGVLRAETDGGDGAVTIPADWTLEARVKGPDEGEAASFEVELESTGGTVALSGNDYIGTEPLRNRFTQLRIPLSDFGGATEFDVSSVAIRSVDGTLFIDDLRFVGTEDIER